MLFPTIEYLVGEISEHLVVSTLKSVAKVENFLAILVTEESSQNRSRLVLSLPNLVSALNFNASFVKEAKFSLQEIV